MRDLLRQWWPWLKLFLFVGVLVAVGFHFAKLLRSSDEVLWDSLAQTSILPLLCSGLLYLLGLGFAASFWLWLMRRLNQSIPTLAGIRGYYISHLGKYVPGKGLALVLRTTFAVDAGAKASLSALSAVYETLTFMASGALIAVVLLPWMTTDQGNLIWSALGLLALAGIPILPGVFNRIVRKMAGRFLKDENPPQLRNTSLLFGLGLTSIGWLFLGASFFVLWKAVYSETISWNLESYLRCVCVVALSYVAGFLALFTPGGLGVRELLLQQLLAPSLGPRAVVLVLLLRLLWTVAELLMTVIVFWLPVNPPHSSTLARVD